MAFCFISSPHSFSSHSAPIMNVLFIIFLIGACLYFLIVGCILVHLRGGCVKPLGKFRLFFSRAIANSSSLHRPSRFTSSDLEMQSVPNSLTLPAQAHLANDRTSATNVVRRRFHKPAFPTSLSIISFKKFSAKAIAYPRKALERFYRRPELGGGPATSAPSSGVNWVVPLEGYSPPGSPLEFRFLEDDEAESVTTVAGCSFDSVPTEDEPAADDASGVHPFYSNQDSHASLSPTSVSPGEGPVWV